MANNPMNPEVLGPEAVGGSALAVIQKAEIDVQVATAHQFPRSMQSFKKRALDMVTLDEETAQSCIYRRPVGEKYDKTLKKMVQEFAEGKSIRMAEIVGASYGNLRVGAIIVEMTPRYVKARGMAHDLESNFAATSEVVEATVTKEGKPYSERMRIVVAKAALSKARRDATFQVVPGALCKSLEEAARKTAIGTTETLGKRRALLADWINKLGVEPTRVWSALGINGLEDVGLDELEKLIGIRTAIKDGDISAEEAFPVPGAKGTDTATLTDKYAKPQEALPALPEPEPAPLPDPEPSGDPGPSQVVSGPCEDGYIQEVKEKSGKTGTKAWVRFGILVNDQWHNTFDSKLADACKSLKADGLRGILSYEVNAKGFRDIKSVHASANTAPPSDPTEGMEEGIP